MYDLLKLRDLSPDTMSPEYQAQLDRVDEYFQKIGKAFTWDFVDELWTETGRLSSIQANESFLDGLRLGAQLTLALLLPQ